MSVKKNKGRGTDTKDTTEDKKVEVVDTVEEVKEEVEIAVEKQDVQVEAYAKVKDIIKELEEANKLPINDGSDNLIASLMYKLLLEVTANRDVRITELFNNPVFDMNVSHRGELNWSWGEDSKEAYNSLLYIIFCKINKLPARKDSVANLSETFESLSRLV